MLAQFAKLMYNVFNSIQEALMRVFNIEETKNEYSTRDV